jgi:putative membrane protein
VTQQTPDAEPVDPLTEPGTDPALAAGPPPGVEPFPWRRLDPRMLLVHPVLELMKFLPFLVGVFVLGSSSGNGYWQLIGVGIPVVLGVVRFLTTQYRITDAQVELQRGLIGRKVLTARLDRVRAVEVTSSPIHRILGLAKVEIGTASGAHDEDKFALDGLPLEQAREMRVALLHRADPGTATAAPGAEPEDVPNGLSAEDVPLLEFDRRWVRYAPLTSSGNVIAAGVMAVLGQFSESIGDRFFSAIDVVGWVKDQPLATFVPLVVAVFAIGFLVLGAIFSVLGYLITNWGFTLSRDARGRTFHVRRGLLTTTETSLERERVRGLEVVEPLGLRLVGAARLAAIVTGVSGSESGSSQLVPPAPREVIDATGAAVLERTEPLHLPLVQHGPAARRRRYTRALLTAAVVPVLAVVLAVATPVDWWVVLPALLLLPVAAALAADRFRRLGHGLSEGYLVVRSGSLSGRRDVLQRSGIIGWNVHQSWFQRRAGLVTLVATTAAGRQAYAALDIPESLAIELADSAVPGLVTPFLA